MYIMHCSFANVQFYVFLTEAAEKRGLPFFFLTSHTALTEPLGLCSVRTICSIVGSVYISESKGFYNMDKQTDSDLHCKINTTKMGMKNVNKPLAVVYS